MIIWVDIETTGLDPRKDAILEVAAVVTYDDLEEWGSMQILAQPDERVRLVDVDPFVLKMHTKNGLWDDLKCVPRGSSLDESLGKMAQYLSLLMRECDKAPMGGNSVHFDREFINMYGHQSNGKFPGRDAFMKLFTHRNVDVSSIRRFVEGVDPEVVEGWMASPLKVDAHRALPDCKQSILEYMHYSAWSKSLMPNVEAQFCHLG